MCKILFIEDDYLIHAISKYYLNKLGYQDIDFVFSVEEALQKDLLSYAFIISDFNLGEGDNGLELVSILRDQLRLAIPVIMVSTTPHQSIQGALKRKFIQGFLLKPFSVAELKGAIKKITQKLLKDPLEKPETSIFENAENFHPSVELIRDLMKGADFSYSRIAYWIQVSPSSIQKLATTPGRKPRFRLYHRLLKLHYKIFLGEHATEEARKYWAKKQNDSKTPPDEEDK